MTLVKIDHPRRIDRFIDYFGERTASDDPRPAAGHDVTAAEHAADLGQLPGGLGGVERPVS